VEENTCLHLDCLDSTASATAGGRFYRLLGPHLSAAHSSMSLSVNTVNGGHALTGVTKASTSQAEKNIIIKRKRERKDKNKTVGTKKIKNEKHFQAKELKKTN
jgi:hypothetical protein